VFPVVHHVSRARFTILGCLQLHDNFHAVFGLDKARRLGQAECESLGLHLNPVDGDLTSPALAALAHDRSAQVATCTPSTILILLLFRSICSSVRRGQ
jgi:hypothetical protein